MTLPVSPCGTLRRGVADLAGLLAEDGAQQALFGGELGLALGRDLADQHVAGLDLGADADDPALVEVGEDVLAQVRDVPGDLFGAELGVAGIDLVLLDVDRREHVVLHQALGEDDGVLEVVALPGHEGHEEVLAEGELAVVGGGTVGQDVAGVDLLAGFDDGPLVDAGVLVGPLELVELVGDVALRLVRDLDERAVDLDDLAVVGGDDHVGGVAGGAGFDAGADVGRLGLDQRHGLLLHVGAHERTVGVVVLEERDERGADRHDLLGRDVHELDLGRRARTGCRWWRRRRCRARAGGGGPRGRRPAASGARARAPGRRCRRASIGVLAWATTYSSSSSAAR